LEQLPLPEKLTVEKKKMLKGPNQLLSRVRVKTRATEKIWGVGRKKKPEQKKTFTTVKSRPQGMSKKGWNVAKRIGQFGANCPGRPKRPQSL